MFELIYVRKGKNQFRDFVNYEFESLKKAK